MSTYDLHLDEWIYAKAKRLAEAKNVSVEELVSEAIERFSLNSVEISTAASSSRGDVASDGNIIGAMAEYAEELDEIVEEAYRNRELRPLRRTRE